MSECAADAAGAEQLVARATAEALAGPDWALNMALCDLANAQPLVCVGAVGVWGCGDRR